MKRKFLYALTLLLCVSTVAFSKDCARYWCGSAGKSRVPAATGTKACSGKASGDATVQANHLFLHTFIRILYI